MFILIWIVGLIWGGSLVVVAAMFWRAERQTRDAAAARDHGDRAPARPEPREMGDEHQAVSDEAALLRPSRLPILKTSGEVGITRDRTEAAE